MTNEEIVRAFRRELRSKGGRSWTDEAMMDQFQTEEMCDWLDTALTAKDTAHQKELEEAVKIGERKILDNRTVGWDVDIHQVDGTVCKWRLIQKYDAHPH